MAKSIEYPRASFKVAQEIAAAVDSLGGSCSLEMCAEKMGAKVSGAFNANTNSAIKFGLVNQKSGHLSTSTLYRDIKLAYTDDERRNLLINSFLSPAVFLKLYERFKNKELPIQMLDKMLIKEYEVDENAASRVKKYFIDGARSIGLIDSQNQVIPFETNNSQATDQQEDVPSEVEILEESRGYTPQEIAPTVINLQETDEFAFQITGPGINSKIAIREEEDFLILEAMIKKIKKRFGPIG